MFGLPVDNPDVICPDCRRPMIELDKMARAANGDAVGLDAGDGYFGNMYSGAGRSILALELFFQMIDMLFGSIRTAFRARKLRKLAAETLPQFPRSVICPVCFFLLRRK